MALLNVLLSLNLVGHARDLDQTFAKTKAKLGDKTIEIYIADTEARRARGLMFVEKLPPDVGMLFIFDRPQRLGFWMKNTLIPLSIGFLDDACVVRESTEMTVAPTVLTTEFPTYRSRGEARFALEMNRGWFGKSNFVGTKLKLLPGDDRPGFSRCK